MKIEYILYTVHEISKYTNYILWIIYAYKKGRKKVSGKIKKQNILLILSGIFTGAVNGVFGGGGGIPLAFLLRSWAKLSDKTALATCVAVIFPFCLGRCCWVPAAGRALPLSVC